MNKSNNATLTEGSINITLIKLTIPMIFGLIGMVIFNLVDTYYVGKLGTDELAALSFSFPVVLVISSIALGLGIGASALISRAIGKGDFIEVKRLTTDSLILSVLIVAFFAVIGSFTIKPLFMLLGAKDEVLSLIYQYMIIWYPGIIFVVIPMIGNNAMRAIGDTLTPGFIMLFASLVNFILDPVLIFKILYFPGLNISIYKFSFYINPVYIKGLGLGIKGAAIATVFARAITLIVSITILIFKYKMLTLKIKSVNNVIKSWGRIIYIGIPTAVTRLLVPLSMGILTKILSGYGKETVAAFGVSGKIEFFIMATVFALGTIIGPFIGQNWGAKKTERVKKGIKNSYYFSLIWGLLAFLLVAIFAKPIASVFNNNQDVIDKIALYLRIIPIGYGLLGIFYISCTALNVLHRPLYSLALTFFQMIIICIPFSILGSYFFKTPGVFSGLASAYILGGISSYFVLKYIVKRDTNSLKIEYN